jgi:hypothetical protein
MLAPSKLEESIENFCEPITPGLPVRSIACVRACVCVCV